LARSPPSQERVSNPSEFFTNGAFGRRFPKIAVVLSNILRKAKISCPRFPGVALAILAAAATPEKQAFAAATTDPLHAFCVSASCPSNGANFTTTRNPPPPFGFYQDPGGLSATDFLLEVLVPNNENTNPGTITAIADGLLPGTSAATTAPGAR
jgi:hypothetical protein